MFQYAFGKRLAIDHNVPLKLDVNWYSKNSSRIFRLHDFNISTPIALDEEINLVKTQGTRRLYQIFSRNIFRSKSKNRSIIKEVKLGFDIEKLNISPSVYLSGYWQSPKYFESIDSILRNEFTLREGFSEYGLKYMKLIQETNSICIHIRRGDYISNPIISSVHGVCSEDYYWSAIRRISSTLCHPTFFVFSDEPESASSMLGSLPNAHFIEGTRDENEDLLLMSHGQAHIISNSTFSWWGAWLSRGHGQNVIAPKRWFTNGDCPNDLIPAHWSSQ